MPELDPKSLEFDQEIEISDNASFFPYRRGVFCGFNSETGEYGIVLRDDILAWDKYARLPDKPKRPGIEPGTPVSTSAHTDALFIRWDDDGKPVVAQGVSVTRIKISGSWYPPQEED